jgi:AraC-like DNA-binding protein
MTMELDRAAFEQMGAPISLEYVKREGSFRMAVDHYHSFYELYFLLSGTRRYFIRDRSYLVEQGDLVFVDRQSLHQTSDAGSPSHERLVIYFEESYVRKAYKAESELLLSPFRRDNPVLRFPVKERLQAEAIAHKLLHEMRSRETGHELAIRSGVIELLLLAARCADKNDAASAADPLDTPLYRLMSDVARHVNNHYAEELSLPGLAEHFHISPYYLSRMFKQATGFNLNEYINLTRIQAAERLLKESELSVIDVSAAVGYNNFSHFGKMFKKLTKQSPREYRKG